MSKNTMKLMAAVLVAGASLAASAAEKSAPTTLPVSPEAMQAANQEIRAKSRPQNVFATPILNPLAEKAWGEPAIAWHNGEYFLIYDNFPVKSDPACLMISTDGVYWKEEGALFPSSDDNGQYLNTFACADVRQFERHGPFVLSYDVRTLGNKWMRRFAVSADLRNWRKLEGISFKADERYYKQPFYNQYSIANPDGGWYAVLNAAPNDFVGMGLGRSQDGIHWECLPAVRVNGVVDQQQGKAGAGCKALEVSGVVKLAGRYFVAGGNPLTGADIIVASDRIEGPYCPTPKNSIQMRGPQVFQRFYDLPGGYLSMPMVWAQRDRKYYHVAPFRSVVSDGESLWFKWWQGNEKLKVHPLAVSLQAGENPERGLRMSNERFDFAKGLVLEGTVALPGASGSATNWARAAKVSAGNVLSKPWWPADYFTPGKAVDHQQTTAWRGFSSDKKSPVNFDLDLGEPRPIGSIRIKWLARPAVPVVKHSRDGKVWASLPEMPHASAGSVLTVPNGVGVDDLNISARFLRIECGAGGGISEIVVSPEPFERIPKQTGGLFLETKPGEGWAWLIERTGRIRFGKVSDNGTRFQSLKERDLEVEFGTTVALRIVMRDDLVDLYVNDYQVDYYQLTGDAVSGRIGLFSPEPGRALKAWMPDPTVGTK